MRFGVVLLTCLIVPTLARAGNDDELLVGTRAAMLGGAVSATIQDSSAIWYNPAGLGGVRRDQIDASATAYTLRSYTSPRLISTASGASDNSSVTEFVVAPTQVAFVRRLGEHTALGLGYFVPHASNYVLRESLEDDTTEQPSQWQIASANAETQHVGAAAVGFTVSPAVRLGVSLFGGYSSSIDSVALFGAVSQNGSTVASNSVTLIGTNTRISMQLGFGTQIDLSRALALGVMVRSPEVQFYSTFNSSYNSSVTSLLGPNAPVANARETESEVPRGLELLKAGRAGVSLTYRYNGGSLTGEVDYQPPLHRRRVSVERKTVVNARVGWYHTLSRSFAFGVGLFSDRSSAARDYDFVEGSGSFYGASAGIELSNLHWLDAQERAKSLIFTSVFAFRYAFTFGDFGRVIGEPALIEQNQCLLDQGRIVIHEFGLYVGGGLHF